MAGVRDILISNLSLVEQQEKLLMEREKEILRLQAENNALRNRLERMERRLTLNKHGDSSTSPNDCQKAALKRKLPLPEANGISSKKLSTTMPNGGTDRDHVDGDGVHVARTLKKTHKSTIVSQLAAQSPLKRRLADSRTATRSHKRHDSLTSKVAASIEGDIVATRRRGMPTPQKHIASTRNATMNTRNYDQITYDVNSDDGSQTIKQTLSVTEKLATLVTVLPKSRKLNRKRLKIPKDQDITSTSVQYYVPNDCRACSVVPAPSKTRSRHADDVAVPSFRTKIYQPYYVIDGRENFEDEVYLERHKKPENDEKKRKRWDLQQQREEETRRKLMSSQRYQQLDYITPTSTPMKEANNNSRSSHLPTTLEPDPANIKYIEVCDELPVSVFGFPLPSSHQNQEFSLPWFDAAKREKEESGRKCRSRRR